MAKPSWISLNKSSGTGGGRVNVIASENTGSSQRSGTLTIRTSSGLTKSVSVSQEGVKILRCTVPDGFIFYSDINIGILYEISLYYRIGANGPGQYGSFGGGSVTINAHSQQTINVFNPVSITTGNGSAVLMGFTFTFYQYLNVGFPNEISCDSTSIRIGSVSRSTYQLNRTVTRGIRITQMWSADVSVSADTTISTGDLYYTFS